VHGRVGSTDGSVCAISGVYIDALSRHPPPDTRICNP
jgi:hypothetical protein